MTTGGYQIRRVLGVANFSPEFAMPVELIYNSSSDTTGVFGYRWNAPQLESRVFPRENGAEWVTPWGEKVGFYSKKNAEADPALRDIHGEQLEGAGFFSPYSDWEAVGSRGNWTVRGREDKPYAGWTFTYEDTRLTKAESPAGRNIRFSYSSEGAVTSVKQDDTAFIDVEYNKGLLSGLRISGVSVSVDFRTVAVRQLPETADQAVLVNDRQTVASVKIGDLAPETFGYQENGWLCRTERGGMTDEMEIETETAAEHIARLSNDKALEQAQSDYKAALALSEDDTQKESVRQQARDKALMLKASLDAAAKGVSGKQDGRLAKDRTFAYGYDYGKKGLSGVSVSTNDGKTSRYSFNAETGVLQLTDFAGRKQTIYYYRRYDVAYNGKLREMTDAKDRPVVNYRYDNETGNLLSVRTMAGNETHYTYDKKNRMTGVSRLEPGAEQPLRPLVDIAYDKKGNPETVRLLDTKGQPVYATAFSHDKYNQLEKVATPEGEERIQYTSGGRVAKATDRFGRSVTREYDKYNRLTKTKDAYGIETRVEYTGSGLARKIVRLKPSFEPAAGDELLSSVEFAYSDMGQVKEITDHRGRTKKYDRDEEGRIVKEYFPDDTAVGYGYTALGQLDQVTDRNGNPIRFAWSKFGTMESRTTAVGQQNLYEYDEYGLIVGLRSVDAQGVTDRQFRYEHDAFDRVCKIDFSDGRTKELAYDALGRMTKVVTDSKEETVTLTLSYDAFDRVALREETRQPKDEGKAETLRAEYAYTVSGKRLRTTLTFPDGKTTAQNFLYDAAGRLSAIEQNGKTLNYEYDEMSRVSRQIVGGAVIQYVYDGKGQLTEKFIPGNSADGKLASLKYFYTIDGEISAREVNGKKQTFEYDARGQLLAVKDENGNDVERYVYDPEGNVLSKTVNGKTTTFTYDAANQLVTANQPDGTEKHFEYDAAGRMIREGGKRYAYGWLDKVTEVTEDGDTVAKFSYHSNGQIAHVSRKAGEDESFYWDGLALVRRNQKNYLNEPYPTGGNPVLAWSDAADQAEAKEAATRLLFNDMLGSTIGILESDQSVKETNLTLFGEGGKETDTFFTGKPNVEETGYAFLFRSYRSEYSKWHTADPLGYPDGFNNLAYCNNGVGNGVDPYGLMTAEVALLCAAVPAFGLFYNTVSLYAALENGVDEWNYKGFKRWLDEEGDIQLDWSAFDNGSTFFNLLYNMYLANQDLIVSSSKGLAIGSSISIGSIRPNESSIPGTSHNGWISSYTMSIVANYNIVITRTSATHVSAQIGARLKCEDTADFNPGESFGLWNIFQDDWFILMRDCGIGADYNERAFKDAFRAFNVEAPE